jgi:hypothetical protein
MTHREEEQRLQGWYKEARALWIASRLRQNTGRVEKVVKGERVVDDEPPRLEHKET